MFNDGRDLRNKDVYTPLGKGKVVHQFPNGTFAVELAHGGGHVFRAGELMLEVTRRGWQEVRYLDGDGQTV